MAVRRVLSFAAVGAAVLAVIVAVRFGRTGGDEPFRDAADPNGGHLPGTPTLYCEFNNFADLTPLVGFYFQVTGTSAAPTFPLIFRREKDGSQTDGGADGEPSPPWILEGSDGTPVLRAPEGDMQINLYGYDPKRPGTVWFEAGLRSVRYKNLGGRCRRSG